MLGFLVGKVGWLGGGWWLVGRWDGGEGGEGGPSMDPLLWSMQSILCYMKYGIDETEREKITATWPTGKTGEVRVSSKSR